MSRLSHNAMVADRPYTQSPFDDMYAMFYTAIWAVLHNVAIIPTENEVNWRKSLSHTNERDTVVQDIVLVGQKVNCSLLLKAVSPFFREWRSQLESTQPSWEDAWATVEEAGSSADKTMLFHEYAYSAVLSFLKLVKKHEGQLKRHSMGGSVTGSL